MRKFVFNPCWNGEDNLSFYADVKVLPEYKMWGHTEIAQELVHKMEVRNKGKFICDMFGNPAEYIRDENGEYIWGEGIEEDNLVKNKSRETRRDTEKTAKIRKVAITAARKANARKASVEGRVIILKNPRGTFIRNLESKANPGDERDRKRNRHAGKKICGGCYEVNSTTETDFVNPADEIEEDIQDYNEDGYWDVDRQEFVWKEKLPEYATRMGLDKPGWYAILTDAVYYHSCIVTGKPHVVINYWDGKMLFGDEIELAEYGKKAKRIEIPTVEDFEEGGDK